ncbi:MAG: hypothetical protein JW795_05010 [Chitinivibrionales bacterium]|nr:hypothetical protein [Chitinivibrionales bacterium]
MSFDNWFGDHRNWSEEKFLFLLSATAVFVKIAHIFFWIVRHKYIIISSTILLVVGLTYFKVIDVNFFKKLPFAIKMIALSGFTIALGFMIYSDIPKDMVSRKEIQLMKEKYIMKNGRIPDIWPKIYGLRSTLFHIFSIPEENAIGTTNLDNAISSLTFSEDKIKYSILKKDFLESVSGGKQFFMPSLSDEYIGYSQERRFILFNVKKKTFEKYVISTNPDEWIEKVAVFDWEKRQFVFEFEEIWYMSTRKLLRIFELSNGESRLIAERDFGHDTGLFFWTIHNKKVIQFGRFIGEVANNIDILDSSLNPIDHPITIYRKKYNPDLTRIWELLIHPVLPFAIIKDNFRPILGENHDISRLQLWRWEQKKAEDVIIKNHPYYAPIPSNMGTNIDFCIKGMQFSPDNKWLCLQDVTKRPGEDRPDFIAIPVEPDNPNYFGKPLFLGGALDKKKIYSTCWIEKPLCFIASYGNMIYKWNLEEGYEQLKKNPDRLDDQQ